MIVSAGALLANAGSTLAATLGSALGVFAVAARRRRFDLADSGWGLGFAVVAALSYALSAGRGAPLVRALVTALTVLWGVRLSGHIHTRNQGRAEDRRYVDIARRAGSHAHRYLLTRVYLVQAVVLWFVSLPVQFAQYGAGWARWPVWVGVAVWAVGFGFESVGDRQLRSFRANPANAGRVLDSGLWHYTRHPNYFGDACVWWGLYAIACHSWWGAATVLSPIVMTVLLVRGTGKALLERDIRQRRPAYADYVARTSGFVPWPPGWQVARFRRSH